MTTKVYVAVEGTCTAGPDENLFEILQNIDKGTAVRKYSERLQRRVTGGAASLYVVSADGNYVIDSGDEFDREILLKSLEDIARLEKIDPVKRAGLVLVTHNHPDHNANHDIFKNSVWIAEKDDALVGLMLGREENREYNDFRKMYACHRTRGITSDKFTPRSKLHNGLHIIETPGHEKKHAAYVIQDDEIVVINLETKAESKAKRLVYAGDCFCDERYFAKFQSGEKEKAVYGNAIPTEQWIFNNPEEREALDKQNTESMEKIVKSLRSGDALLFGHGGMIIFPD